MSLNYTDTKNILIEAKESCRVPIPVDRCSLEKVVAARAAEVAENLENESATLPLEHLEFSINSNVEQELQQKIFRIDEEAIKVRFMILY